VAAAKYVQMVNAKEEVEPASNAIAMPTAQLGTGVPATLTIQTLRKYAFPSPANRILIAPVTFIATRIQMVMTVLVG
jgi:hypothetical protein